MASVLEPPPPAPLWNLFTALGGLLEEAPRSCVQAKRGRQLETGTLGEAEAEASGNEALAKSCPAPPPLSFATHVCSACCGSGLGAGHSADLVQTLLCAPSGGQVVTSMTDEGCCGALTMFSAGGTHAHAALTPGRKQFRAISTSLIPVLEAKKPAHKPEKSHTAGEWQEAGSHPGLCVSHTGTASATVTTNGEARIAQKPSHWPVRGRVWAC